MCHLQQTLVTLWPNMEIKGTPKATGEGAECGGIMPASSIEKGNMDKEKSLLSLRKLVNEDVKYGGGITDRSTENGDEGKTTSLISARNTADKGVEYGGGMTAGSAENDDQLQQIIELVGKARLMQIERGMRPDPRSTITTDITTLRLARDLWAFSFGRRFRR